MNEVIATEKADAKGVKRQSLLLHSTNIAREYVITPPALFTMFINLRAGIVSNASLAIGCFSQREAR